MNYQHQSVVAHPAEEVFAWHARPGALTRLVPPWRPVEVSRETSSLRDGQAVLALPGHLEWRARHLPEGFEQGRQFVDELVTEPAARVVGWRHTHRFEEVGDGQTRVSDLVETRLPGRLLDPMFAYRTRQLTGDLASHARWSGQGGTPLTVAVTGSSGTIGRALCAFLTSGGHRVVHLVRGTSEGTRGGGGPADGDRRRWDPQAPDPGLLEGVDALVHLAGAPISGRFSATHMARIRDSRVGPTRRLAEAVARAGVPVMVSASAIGYYGADGDDQVLTEESSGGDDFLARLVADWEADTAPARTGGSRVVNIRTGIALTPAGGALRLLRLITSTGLGGPLGDGRAWMSWIGIDDLVDVYLRALVDPRLEGPLNAVSPNPVRNAEFTRTLARVLHRPAVLPVPALGPRLLLGRQGAEEFAMASQRVAPARLAELGHPYRTPELEPTLRHLLGRSASAP